MSEIRIDFLGHACFKVSFENRSVVFDPYENGSVPGLKLPEPLGAGRVYCSHEHGDHNARHLIHETDPLHDPFEVSFLMVPHDDANGALRGMNRITIVKLGACRIIHMGDIGRLPTEEEYEQLCDADVMMIPAGGHYTIDAKQAAEIIARAKPKLAILMHFRKGQTGYDVIADIADVRKAFDSLREYEESSICFDEADVPKGVITLTPAQ